MHWISLPLAAVALAGPMPDGAADIGAKNALPAEYLPCEGTVPVFNPEGCPPARLTVDEPEKPAEAACRDRIALVREENDQPQLDRRPASPERPYLMAAVDKRIDGCPVMQMLHDADDLRSLPAPPDRQVKVYRGS